MDTLEYIGTAEWFTDGEGEIIRIDGKLPSLNDYIGKCRANAYKGAKFKAETEEGIRWEIRRNPDRGKIRALPRPLRLEILWIEKDRRRDVDNVKSATKYILDAMKGDLIEDDGPRYISQITDKVVYDARHPGVRIKFIPGNTEKGDTKDDSQEKDGDKGIRGRGRDPGLAGK